MAVAGPVSICQSVENWIGPRSRTTTSWGFIFFHKTTNNKVYRPCDWSVNFPSWDSLYSSVDYSTDFQKAMSKRRRNSTFPRTVPFQLSLHFCYGMLVVLLWLPHQLRTSATSSVATCDLQCPTKIGAKCLFGDAPSLPGVVSDAPKNIDGMHCACPEFYSGLLCETTYDTCGDGNQHVCFHGGECKTGAVDAYGNAQRYCDCSAAKDPSTQLPYVGKYCELATVATCADPNNPDLFCFNGGICNEKYP
jgi:hypothetical protein